MNSPNPLYSTNTGVGRISPSALLAKIRQTNKKMSTTPGANVMKRFSFLADDEAK